jgi:hypothetical protein
MNAALYVDCRESKRYYSRSAIISWLVGACLVGFVLGLAVLVWE